MAGRIVLFGATGYTGRLTAEAMLERGLRPVLAARSPERLEELAEQLGGGLEIAVADVSDPLSVSALVERGDVLVTTVGPFERFGSPAAAAASTAGAHYLDTAGEPAFIREVFERYGRAADRAGSGMLTAFGFDWVPGNLAGALALQRAGDEAVRVDIGYFLLGSSPVLSGGTMASLVRVVSGAGFAFRDGRVSIERGGKRVRSFPVGDRTREAFSVATSEHFALPRVAAQLREVNTYVGWVGPLARSVQLASVGLKAPGAGRLVRAVGERVVKGSTGGPDAESRVKSGSQVVALAYDGAGGRLAEVHLDGVNAYTFTGRILAWGAERAAGGGLQGTGALGPVDGFGAVALTDGCAWAGLSEEGGSRTASGASKPAHAALD